jgi:hypothetical protein
MTQGIGLYYKGGLLLTLIGLKYYYKYIKLLFYIYHIDFSFIFDLFILKNIYSRRVFFSVFKKMFFSFFNFALTELYKF